MSVRFTSFVPAKMVQVPTPPCGILTFTEAASFGPIGHRLDATSDPAGCFGLHGPNGFESPHDQTAMKDRLDIQWARIT
jgi:hypothetical protein